MKKTIVTVFGVIIVLILMGMLVNVVTGGAFVNSILTAVATPINDAWMSISGSDTPLIVVDDIITDAGLDDGGTSINEQYGGDGG